MVFEEIWDSIVDGFAYVFSFEWFGDVGEFFGTMFENMAEFSIIGATFGLISFGTIYFARNYMLNPFLIHMGPVESIFWATATYLGSFIGGYLLGKHFENT